MLHVEGIPPSPLSDTLTRSSTPFYIFLYIYTEHECYISTVDDAMIGPIIVSIEKYIPPSIKNVLKVLIQSKKVTNTIPLYKFFILLLVSLFYSLLCSLFLYSIACFFISLFSLSFPMFLSGYLIIQSNGHKIKRERER